MADLLVVALAEPHDRYRSSR